MTTLHPEINAHQLAQDIKQWGKELGFQQIGITDIDLTQAETRLQAWLAQGYHGEMEYMQRHGTKRSRPNELIPGTTRVILARMHYFPETTPSLQVLENPFLGFISRYALGRDYHKLIRKRLDNLAQKINTVISNWQYRVFTDSGPVMEKPLAQKAGLGWIGKHTNLINSQEGSWFFLGAIYTNLPLPIDTPATAHCGSCSACIDICPTQAIIGPYQLDASRCISYLTIELKGSIPEDLRPLLGNRIYGCDDCQLVCPWNKFAQLTQEKDFAVRNGLDASELLQLFTWTETQFMQRMEGSAIRRIGYDCWLRNIAVALGNAPYSLEILAALNQQKSHPSVLVQEHVVWAIEQQLLKKSKT